MKFLVVNKSGFAATVEGAKRLGQSVVSGGKRVVVVLTGLAVGAQVVMAQSAATLPDVSATMDTVKGLAYTAITIAVAIVGVKMGIRFVKWVRG